MHVRFKRPAIRYFTFCKWNYKWLQIYNFNGFSKGKIRFMKWRSGGGQKSTPIVRTVNSYRIFPSQGFLISTSPSGPSRSLLLPVGSGVDQKHLASKMLLHGFQNRKILFYRLPVVLHTELWILLGFWMLIIYAKNSCWPW